MKKRHCEICEIPLVRREVRYCETCHNWILIGRHIMAAQDYFRRVQHAK